MESNAGFARDFGYLDKFLAALLAGAAAQPGPRGERLRALLAGEPERWREIRALLEGAEAVAPSAAPSAPAAALARPSLTVGSLRQSPPAAVPNPDTAEDS